MTTGQIGEHKATQIPTTTKVWICALRDKGHSIRQIAKIVGHGTTTVQVVLRQRKRESDAGLEPRLKDALPARMREVASKLIDRLDDPSVIDEMKGRDLAVAAGIMVDKAIVMEQAGQTQNILSTIQARLEAEEAKRLLGSTPALPESTPADQVEDAIVVQRCPEKVGEKDAPSEDYQPDLEDLRQERV